MTKLTMRNAADRKGANHEGAPTKLTKGQRSVLSRAARREDGVAARPENMTQKAVLAIRASLVESGLAREVRAKADMPVWRRDAGERSFALIVTKRGREAVKDKDDRAGVEAEPGGPTSSPIEHTELSQPAAVPTIAGSCQPDCSLPRAGSKLADVMRLLGRKQGAGIEELTSATGWLPHTTRAALTGLRKRGFAVERSRSEQGGSLYRIVASAAPAPAA
jgi:hypothetical protein